jgi:hypothetical protein
MDAVVSRVRVVAMFTIPAKVRIRVFIGLSFFSARMGELEL